ncbi:hypothetical protein [Streptomyces sp. ME19-01-6]|uniref:hypothetical protein n=1 Tax=Streptomyces sp. ME19-01-6 TaxID=3028686 RepID=UPI0029B2840B|nr:hypothetical protein [Streptomyces sp. ME19-01-6]MDX3229365.1 hypothetical protein [Streptomyces sp. ME19-01-6]
MLSLRLARGARPLALLRRSLVATAAAGTGFLLLCALGYAAGHPEQTDGAVVRLLWCAVPLAATAHLAVAVSRADPSVPFGAVFAAAGGGPARSALLAAASAALSCALGCALALLAFLQLRGDLGGSWLPWAGVASGAASGPLGIGYPLPAAATVTLLAVVPAVAAAACAGRLWPRGAQRARVGGRARPRAAERVPRGAAPPDLAARGLPWGIALTAAGIALEAFANSSDSGPPPPPDALLPLPGGLGGSPPGVVGGWALTAVGLVLAGPGLTHLCGRLLAAGRPGTLRLLAGRVLQQEAGRLGHSVGVLCAVATGAYAAVELYGTGAGPSGNRPFGPLTGLGAALIMMCATASALMAALEAKSARNGTTDALLRLGAPPRLLRGAAALRGLALLVLLTPLTWAVAELSTLPFNR